MDAGLSDLLEFCQTKCGFKVDIRSDFEIDITEVAITLLEVVPRGSELILPVWRGIIVVEFEEWRKKVKVL